MAAKKSRKPKLPKSSKVELLLLPEKSKVELLLLPEKIAFPEKPRRIAILYLENSPYGRLGAYVTELAAALERRGNEVHVYTRKDEVLVGSDLQSYKNAQVFCEEIVKQMLEEYTKRPFDIIHLHEWHAGYAGIKLRQKYRGRLVFTLHSTEKLRCTEIMGKESQKIHRLERLVTNISNRIIARNPQVREQICRDFSIPQGKVALIYDGFRHTEFKGLSDPGIVKRRYDIGPIDPMVLFVGEFNEANGPNIVMAAIPTLVQRHPSLRFVFVGDGELMWPLRIHAHYFNIEHAVRLIGHQEGKELHELFQASDIVVIPSRSRSTPYQLLAAWSAEKPVVATYEGCFGLIDHEKNGIQVYDNPNSFIWGIERILYDRDHAHFMGKNGWKTIKKNFTWDAVARQVEKVYRNLSASAPC